MQKNTENAKKKKKLCSWRGRINTGVWCTGSIGNNRLDQINLIVINASITNMMEVSAFFRSRSILLFASFVYILNCYSSYQTFCRGLEYRNNGTQEMFKSTAKYAIKTFLIPKTLHCTDTPLLNIVLMKKKYFFKIFFEDTFLSLFILCQEKKFQNFWIRIERVKFFSKSRKTKNNIRGGF